MNKTTGLVINHTKALTRSINNPNIKAPPIKIAHTIRNAKTKSPNAKPPNSAIALTHIIIPIVI